MRKCSTAGEASKQRGSRNRPSYRQLIDHSLGYWQLIAVKLLQPDCSQFIIAAMKEFKQFLEENTHWKLTNQEIIRLYQKYNDPITHVVRYDEFLNDMKNGILTKQSQTVNSITGVLRRKKLTYSELMKLMCQHIKQLFRNTKGEHMAKKLYLLMSDNRSTVVRRDQLKLILQIRMHFPIFDDEVADIFKHLDNQDEGVVRIQQFIQAVSKYDDEKTEMSLVINEHTKPHRHSIHQQNQEDNQNASYTYDRKVKGLFPPDPAKCGMYSIGDIENFIWQRLFERANTGNNLLKTTLRLFTDGQSVQGERYISLDQLRYTLWKKLRADIRDDDVVKFYNHHAAAHPQLGIRLLDFMNKVIKARGQSEVLFDDRGSLDNTERMKLSAMMEKKVYLQQFIILIRKSMNDRINRECRAPHYLLHSASRLPVKQFLDYLKTQLWLDVTTMFSTKVLEDILSEYRGSDNLIDTKRILLGAMALSEQTIRKAQTPITGSIGSTGRPQSASAASALERDSEFAQQTLLNGAQVAIDRMPLSLQLTHYTPEEIEQKICEKCFERIKTSHPHAALVKYFRGVTSDDTRSITKQGMIRVLRNFDLIFSSEDFAAFYAKHDRGDGKIDIPTFLKRLMPPLDVNDNPFSPKDPVEVRLETDLMQVVQEVTGVRKEISCLNGIKQTRMNRIFLHNIQPPTPTSTIAEVAGEEGQEVARQSVSISFSPSRPSSANPFATSSSSRRPPSSHRGIRPSSVPTTEQVTTNPIPIPTPAPTPVEDETLTYAQGLLNAMKDLSIFSSPSPSPSALPSRPQSAPSYRQLQSQLLMSLAKKYAEGEETGQGMGKRGDEQGDDGGSVMSMVSAHTTKTATTNHRNQKVSSLYVSCILFLLPKVTLSLLLTLG
ncbi:hypothetical protein EON65_07775 [archaeon]|nr:MAG: hypothetical protein EON65_07775 [archaeon]